MPVQVLAALLVGVVVQGGAPYQPFQLLLGVELELVASRCGAGRVGLRACTIIRMSIPDESTDMHACTQPPAITVL